jgi:hypothetical protein
MKLEGGPTKFFEQVKDGGTPPPQQPQVGEGKIPIAPPKSGARANTAPKAESKPQPNQPKNTRRRKPESEKQNHLVGAHLTDAELGLVKTAAKAAGLKPGRFMVQCALTRIPELLAGQKLYLETLIERAVAKGIKRSNQSTN